MLVSLCSCVADFFGCSLWQLSSSVYAHLDRAPIREQIIYIPANQREVDKGLFLDILPVERIQLVKIDRLIDD
jgi:hypothetical protein